MTRGAKKELVRLLRQVRPLVVPRRGRRQLTTITLSDSERDLLDKTADVLKISRATVLRTGLPLAVAQLLEADS